MQSQPILEKLNGLCFVSIGHGVSPDNFYDMKKLAGK
jgi:hypothetical protein